jgi:predicted transcriptional regulator of viral defense system
MRTRRNTYSGIQILRYLASEQGLSIFDSDQARRAAQRFNISHEYVPEALHYLEKDGWIFRLKRGLYAFSIDSGMGTPPHEYEIATVLVLPSTISHWTAMHYHHLTQQTPNTVFATTPTGTSIPRSVDRRHFHYIRVKPQHYFGFEKIWLEHSQVLITDLERTLLDGLINPKYCGDFQEVLHAFKVAKEHLSLEKLMKYSLLLDAAVPKRLGWVLEHIGYTDQRLAALLNAPIKGYRKLDPTGDAKGPYNKKWMIRENIA